MPDTRAVLDRILAAMRERALEALVVYSDGALNILRASHLQYVAGVRPLGPRNAVVIGRRGDVALLVEPAWDRDRVSRLSWIPGVRGTDDLARELPALLRALGATGTVGLVSGDLMTTEVFDRLSGACRVVPADAIVEAAAVQRSPDEVAMARRVAGIADVGFEAFRHAVRAGIREYELLAELEYAMRNAGADDSFNLVASGSHSHGMHAPTDRRLVPGDTVIVEITPVRDGQFVQLCRTVVLGEPATVLAERYALLLTAYRAGVEALGAGRPASGLASAINRVLSEAGYREYCYPPYMRTRGHGFGVGSIAPGIVIDEQTDHALTEHQVIVVHPNQYLPETGYLACGETHLVTAGGAERLARTETRLYVEPV